ncbi:MAG TPA: hypothetical protein VFJ64_10795 [Solirubrobacterales bacterium]|nr:hypothetical protein [Solirubrobacterales bacterium]
MKPAPWPGRSGGGPWMVGGRVYREWHQLPPWFRRQIREEHRRQVHRSNVRKLHGWRRTALGLVVGAGVALLVSEWLWRL